MGQTTLVAYHIADGQRLIAELSRHQVDVTAAAWIKMDEESRWHLYIVSRTVDDGGALTAYRQILPVLRGMGELWVEADDLKVIGAADPMAKDLLALQLPGRTKVPTRLDYVRLGSKFANEGFLYPPLPTAATPEVVANGAEQSPVTTAAPAARTSPPPP